MESLNSRGTKETTQHSVENLAAEAEGDTPEADGGRYLGRSESWEHDGRTTMEGHVDGLSDRGCMETIVPQTMRTKKKGGGYFHDFFTRDTSGTTLLCPGWFFIFVRGIFHHFQTGGGSTARGDEYSRLLQLFFSLLKPRIYCP